MPKGLKYSRNPNMQSKIRFNADKSQFIASVVWKTTTSFPTMPLPSSYILVLDPHRLHRADAHPLEAELQYPVFVASSTEQAVSRVNQGVPSLVILVGNNFQDWSQPLVNQLRQHDQAPDMTSVGMMWG